MEQLPGRTRELVPEDDKEEDVPLVTAWHIKKLSKVHFVKVLLDDLDRGCTAQVGAAAVSEQPGLAAAVPLVPMIPTTGGW